ncbi:PAS domain-containing protein, partial [Kineococcus glutinatus]|uniref:PAS domain-containing protein n=1 Tax=Kineococcus glutinatus TaxID=1070872 RepID=UPI0031E97171
MAERSHPPSRALLEAAGDAAAGSSPTAARPVMAALRQRAADAVGPAFAVSDPGLPGNPLVWVDEAFTHLTGYGAHEAVGRNCRFLQGPGTDPAPVRAMREAVARAEPVDVTLLNHRADGTPFWNRVSLVPVRDEDGRLLHFVAALSDVSERVHAADEVARAHGQERQSRARLALLLELSGAVTDLDVPAALRELARLLARDLVDWALVLQAPGAEVVAAEGALRRGPGELV